VKIVSGREYLLRAVPKGFGSLLGDELFWNIRSAYTGTLSLAGVSVGQFFDGQELRGKGAWKEPEAWGTWLGVDGGILEFVRPEKHSASLLCAVAYRILPIFASKDDQRFRDYRQRRISKKKQHILSAANSRPAIIPLRSIWN